MHPPDTAITSTRPRWRDVGSWTLILVVPGLVASQWLALQALPAARTIFNAALLIAAVVVLVSDRSSLRRDRWLLATAASVVAVGVLSLLVNQVFTRDVAIAGSIPYVFPVLAAMASLIWRPPPGAFSVAIRTVTVVMGLLAVAAVIQLILGETGFRITGQSLTYPRWWERGRATGLVVNPARLAHLGLVGVALAPLCQRWRWPLAVAGGIAAAASGGRVVLLSLVALAVVAVVARRWEGRKTLLIGVLITAGFFGLFQMTVPSASDDLVDRIETTIDGIEVDVRVENLRASARLIADKPLLGAGPGRFGSTTAFATDSDLHDEYGLIDVRSAEFVEELREQGDFREIDAGTPQLDIGLLQIATELGVLGVIATGAFAAGLLRQTIKTQSLVSLSLLVLLGVFTLTGPGWVDVSIAGTVLWWMGAAIGKTTSDAVSV